MPRTNDRPSWLWFRVAAAFVAAGLLLSGPGATVLQAQPAAGTQGPIPPDQTSPRAVLISFLERMAGDKKQEAATLLDLSALNPEAASAKGPELAYKLYTVMQRLVQMPGGQAWPPIDNEQAFANVPASPDFIGAWSLSALDRYADARANRIKIASDGEGRWLFTTDTVAEIEPLFAEEEEDLALAPPAVDARTTEPFQVWFRKHWPEALRETHFLIPTYQWISLLGIAGLARVVELSGRRLLTFVFDRVLQATDPDFKESTNKVWKPVGRLANAASWYAGAYYVGLPLTVIGVLLGVLKLVTIVAAVVAIFAIIRLVSDYVHRRAKRTDRKFDDLIVPITATTLRVVTIVVASVVAIATFIGTVPSALLGGLGIGGVAIALASQETLSNFFGSITVLFDRPFEVGDWVVIDGLEGEVETVGFRSTRIRTGMNSQVTLPNSKLAAAAIDNWGRRRYRRYLTRLGVEYSTTPDQMHAFCEGIRELIRRQPHTRKDFYAAYFNDFGGSALEILLVVFFEVPDWPTELRERHRLLTDILQLAERLGVGFAFPTQTVYLHRSDAPLPPPSLTDAEFAGQASAADIAGELLNYQDRPGKVKFAGPTPVEEIAQRHPEKS